MGLLDELAVLAEDEANEGRMAARAAWHEWVAGTLQNGAGAAHTYTKPGCPWKPGTALALDGRVVADPLHVLAKEAKVLVQAWQATDTPHDRAADVPAAVPRLAGPPLEVAALRAASLTFKAATATQAGGLHPRHIAMLPDEGVQAFCNLLRSVELLGAWPMQVSLVLTVLLPKPKGGWRGIGLYPAFHRVYTRARRPVAKQWEQLHKRPFFAAAAGQGPEQVVWRQSLRAEMAVADGLSCGSVLWDLRKFFEFVDLNTLRARGLEADFNPRVLAAVVAGYKFARSISGHAGVTAPRWANSGVTPGCGMAATTILVYCLKPFDRLVECCRPLMVEWDFYFDDFHVSATGTPLQVASRLAQASGRMERMVREELCCQVAQDKGGLVASDAATLAMIKKKLEFRGLPGAPPPWPAAPTSVSTMWRARRPGMLACTPAGQEAASSA